MKLFFVIASIVALAFVANAGAQSCYRNYSYGYSYVAPTPVYASQLVVAPVLVPSYTVGIQAAYLATVAPQVAVPQQTAAAPQSECMAEIAKLRAELNALRGGALPMPPGPVSTPQPTSNASVAQAIAVERKNCAGCHDKSVAGAKGRGIAFFDGENLMALDANLKLAILDQVMSGEMPPGGKLSDDDAGIIAAHMTGRLNKSPAKAGAK